MGYWWLGVGELDLNFRILVICDPENQIWKIQKFFRLSWNPDLLQLQPLV